MSSLRCTFEAAYGTRVFGNSINETQVAKLDKLQHRAAKVTTSNGSDIHKQGETIPGPGLGKLQNKN